MPYIHKISCGGNIAIVEDYHTYRYNSSSRCRSVNSKKTTETQKRINSRRSAQKLILTVAENFAKGDRFIRLSYYKGQRPESLEEAHKNLTKLFKKLKRKCNLLYYVANTEEGSHGGLHHHILIPSWYDVENIVRNWDGGVYISRVYSGELSQLASYFTKGELDDQFPEDERDVRHHKAVKNMKITKSANLRKPQKPMVKVVRADHWRKDPAGKKIDGVFYDVKPGSVWLGFTSDGYPYRKYIMIARR